MNDFIRTSNRLTSTTINAENAEIAEFNTRLDGVAFSVTL